MKLRVAAGFDGEEMDGKDVLRRRGDLIGLELCMVVRGGRGVALRGRREGRVSSFW